MLTMLAVVMVLVALVSSIAIRKMLAAADKHQPEVELTEAES
ncbi:di-/tripeptide transporter [Vibrio variabilis]|uniref:Di-/tripeptide transporter n=2 Tax=Vibrio TaxID=662 RepID=A0ABQ0JE15_9VIBR|nr:di-/tripeptide transporter [Vibrio variabilis]